MTSIYGNMNSRCNYVNNPNYGNYGGRGIKVMWTSFKEFYNDMIDGYSHEMEIDRVDNNGNYSKENCRWATRKQQMNNTRSNTLLTICNQVITLKQASERYEINHHTLRARIDRGWSHEDAVKIKIDTRFHKRT